jgi:type IV pilus assembly protein PilW
MSLNHKYMPLHQTGFSLVEILVGLLIGLLTTLVIMQVFTVFEGQKRSTTGSADAQTNGSIALYTIQRDVQMAGFGLPVFDTVNPSLKCDPSPTVDHDNNAATAKIDIFPLSITDGGAAAGASDSIAVRYGSTSMGGVSTNIIGVAGSVAGVANNLGCQNNDIALISNGAACGMTRVNDADLAADTIHITLQSAPASLVANASLACLGRWNQFEYTIGGNQLQRNDASSVVPTPIVADIVNIQAQYGVSASANSNQVTQWVDATGAWAAPGNTSVVCDAVTANRNCIKAVRVAVVARNGLLEKTNVTAACSSITAAAPTGLCAWEGSAASPAPTIDLSNDADWQRYRYRVFETIIPLRNMIWSRNTL